MRFVSSDEDSLETAAYASIIQGPKTKHTFPSISRQKKTDRKEVTENKAKNLEQIA